MLKSNAKLSEKVDRLKADLADAHSEAEHAHRLLQAEKRTHVVMQMALANLIRDE